MAEGDKAAIQFFRGTDEPVVPDIRMTRSRDGRTGQAIFVFEEPQALAPETMEAIAGMWMVDEEGEMVTREVNGRFVNGKPFALEATYTWKSEADFERFMRFAQRYADSNGMGYSQNSGDNDSSEEGTTGEISALARTCGVADVRAVALEPPRSPDSSVRGCGSRHGGLHLGGCPAQAMDDSEAVGPVDLSARSDVDRGPCSGRDHSAVL